MYRFLKPLAPPNVTPVAQAVVGEAPKGVAPKTARNLLASLLTDSGWVKALDAEFSKDYMARVVQFLQNEEKKGVRVFPPRDLVFSASNLTPLNEVRVVLLGQDPYHDDGQDYRIPIIISGPWLMLLRSPGVRLPPSLRNIYKELSTDIPGFRIPPHGCLNGWAKQGVFMLNASLTVEAHKANSHSTIGWQTFTDAVIQLISRRRDGVVFLLWGGFAHKKEALIDKHRHKIIKTAHPSPLSATKFFGCRCFSATNDALIKFGKSPIDWNSL